MDKPTVRDEGCKNTDREIWRKEDYYSPYILVTKDNGITICVGGSCITKPIEEWHKLALFATEEEIEKIVYTELKKQYKGRLPPNLRISDLAHALSGRISKSPHFTEAQLEEVLPELIKDYCQEECGNAYNSGYNQGVLDCKQALLKGEGR